ncbi:hypothetical protein Dimus_006931 [Dionaea muscipula]
MARTRSSSNFLKLMICVVVLASTMIVGGDGAKLLCRKRHIPPIACLGYLTTGEDKLFDSSCGAALELLNKTEQSTPSNIKLDCQCWKDAAEANILGVPLYNITALQNAPALADVVLRYKLDGTTDCNRM